MNERHEISAHARTSQHTSFEEICWKIEEQARVTAMHRWPGCTYRMVGWKQVQERTVPSYWRDSNGKTSTEYEWSGIAIFIVSKIEDLTAPDAKPARKRDEPRSPLAKDGQNSERSPLPKLYSNLLLLLPGIRRSEDARDDLEEFAAAALKQFGKQGVMFHWVIGSELSLLVGWHWLSRCGRLVEWAASIAEKLVPRISK